MKVVNLTPHAVTLFKQDGSTVVYPPSGAVARVEEERGKLWASSDSTYPFPIRGPNKYGAITGLPTRSPELTVDELSGPFGPPDTVYIVSIVVAEHLRARYAEARLHPEPKSGLGWWEKMLERVKRDDVVHPGELVRDESGRIIGCRDFVSVFD